ncbi:MAG: hypothetical protein CMJ23_09540 [Phycisphaerae bacterium]|nr:hypothetical protein [Phycisphaerae bacterium]
MMELIQSWLLPVAVFLLVTGLWLRVAFPAEEATRDGKGSAKTQAFLISMIPTLMVGGFGVAVWMATGRPIFATIAFGSGYIIATLVRRTGKRRFEERESRYALTAIQTATRVLKAGIPVPGMLEVLARDGEGDTGKAFREVLRREELGESLPDAIRVVLLTGSRPELRTFGMALLLHIDVGGNLVETFDRLAKSILERGRIQRRSDAIITYGRVAGGVLAMAPFVVVPVLSLTLDGYADYVFNRPLGNAIIITSLGLIIAGAYIMQRMTQAVPKQAGTGATV